MKASTLLKYGVVKPTKIGLILTGLGTILVKIIQMDGVPHKELRTSGNTGFNRF